MTIPPHPTPPHPGVVDEREAQTGKRVDGSVPRASEPRRCRMGDLMPLAGCSACLAKGYTEASCVYEGVRCSCGKEEAPTIDISGVLLTMVGDMVLVSWATRL